MESIRLLIVDKHMNTIELEINRLQFQSLGLDLSKIRHHNLKRDLNITITNYLDSFEEKVSK